jgi:hypothetical protein
MSSLRSFLSRPLGWLITITFSLCWALPIAWATLAIYYSNLPWAGMRLALAAAFAAFTIWAIRFSRQRRMSAIAIVLFLGVTVWWITIRPSHDRHWRPEVAVMPRAFIDGDRVRLTGVRNFDYRTRDDFTVRYEEREVLLSHLTALDFYVSYFMAGPVGHTFLSFIFDNAPPLSISIETRPEVGEGFAPIASLFKQFELIYVVGDERDLVGVRTNYRHEAVYLSTPHPTMPAGCCWFTWRGSTNSPIGRSTITCSPIAARSTSCDMRTPPAGSVDLTSGICSTAWSIATSIIRAGSIRRCRLTNCGVAR